MAATREQVMTAVLALVANVPGFNPDNTSRRNRNPEDIEPSQCPAVFALEIGDDYVRSSPSMPPKRQMRVALAIYNDVGGDLNAIPSTPINDALDAIDAALRPTTPSGLCTLGGLVESVVIDGDVHRAPGERTGKAIAIVPLKVTLP